MKRYLVTHFHFDLRPSHLSMAIPDEWDQQAKEAWIKGNQDTIEFLFAEFGPINGFQKIENFKEFGNIPVSIVAFHNKFLQQIQHAYVVGSYYPALTGACSLGERILNHMMLKLRRYFKNTQEYKQVHSKNSFSNWKKTIEILSCWDILLDSARDDFLRLEEKRNYALHFNSDVDANEKEHSLEAIKLLINIIEAQFPAFGIRPWFIEGINGRVFIKKECESLPFIKEIYMPNCEYVGPNHKFTTDNNGKNIIIDDEYPDKEISDEEFVALFGNK